MRAKPLLIHEEPCHLPLTKRQIECLRLVREGKNAKDIAHVLGISANVVAEHIENARKRLGTRTRVQAVMIALKGGLLD